MKLSAAQVAAIEGRINNGGISIESLRNDVLDHICCVVEIKVERGKSFDAAVEEAITELAPDGLERIQDETIFLLSSNKIVLMKKFMYFIGMVSMMAFLTGWLFGLLHLPGAFELSVYGFSGFSFVFLPMLTFDHYKMNIRRAASENLKFILGIGGALIVGAGGIFKALHLPGANLLIVVGCAVFILGFIPFFFFSMYKKSVS